MRKIENVLQIAEFTTSTVVPEGKPLYVQGEADGKETYDFTIQQISSGSAGLGTYQCKYAGMLNGVRVSLRNLQINNSIGPLLAGDTRLTIIPGNGVSIKYYYSN